MIKFINIESDLLRQFKEDAERILREHSQQKELS